MSEKKPVKPVAAKVLESVTFQLPDDAGGQVMYPNLFDLLTPRWEGSVMTRQAGRMSIKPDGSMWRVSIECPTEGLQTSFCVRMLDTLFAEAEKHVSSGTAHWGLTWAKQKKHLPVIDSPIQ
jgi:hypothetical protein